MTNKQSPERLALIVRLAEMLDVDLKDSRLAIATDNRDAKVMFFNGSLEARLIPSIRPTIKIESPRAPGVYIDLVDHQRDLAPADAIYRITAYMPDATQEGSGEQLNGDVYTVYIGRKGIILDDSARKRAAELLSKE